MLSWALLVTLGLWTTALNTEGLAISPAAAAPGAAALWGKCPSQRGDPAELLPSLPAAAGGPPWSPAPGPTTAKLAGLARSQPWGAQLLTTLMKKLLGKPEN